MEFPKSQEMCNKIIYINIGPLKMACSKPGMLLLNWREEATFSSLRTTTIPKLPPPNTNNSTTCNGNTQSRPCKIPVHKQQKSISGAACGDGENRPHECLAAGYVTAPDPGICVPIAS